MPTPFAVTWKTTEIGCRQRRNIYSAQVHKHHAGREDKIQASGITSSSMRMSSMSK